MPSALTLSKQQYQRLVIREMRDLTEKQRAVLALADGSLTVTQIADALECHRGDVSRAVKSLRAAGYNPLVAGTAGQTISALLCHLDAETRDHIIKSIPTGASLIDEIAARLVDSVQEEIGK